MSYQFIEVRLNVIIIIVIKEERKLFKPITNYI